MNVTERLRTVEILGVYNIKGGVGKTTTAVNLAYRSAADGWRTLLWDLDPQGAATYVLRRKQKIKGGLKDLARGETSTADLITPTDYPNLDLLPSDFSYRRMEERFVDKRNPAKQLLKLMRPLHRTYACLIMDCAPGISVVAENVLHAADALVVPLTPSPLSARTLRQLLDFLDRTQWSDLKLLPFFSMIDRRRNLHKETAERLRAEFPVILDTEVPYGAAFEQVAVRRAPVEVFSPKGDAAQVYRALWEEIDRRLDNALLEISRQLP
ncbi:MAG TPA: AAA family ATPase [Gammaproteobacteria bacterium]